MDVFVARQPILDTKENTFAYELLFRGGPENYFPPATDGDHASAKVIHDTLNTFGFDQLAGDKMVFVNITRKPLVQELYSVLPPKRAVIELLETIEPDDEVIAACETARAAGYMLALDDFIFEDKYAPLLRLANIVKIDFLLTTGEERRVVAEKLAQFDVELLAEKVETRADFDQALELGYRYFQGYFFCKPQMIVGQDVPQFKLNYLRLLSAINAPDLEVDDLVEIVKQDPSLSVKLLRYLNSAFFGWKSEIKSLKHAITMIGEIGFRKWATLVTMTNMGGDKPEELLVTCLIRAKFCEQIGEIARVVDPSVDRNVDFFLVGMLSSIDAFIGRPLPEVLDKLALTKEMTSALIRVTEPDFDAGSSRHELPATRVLALVMAYERAAWGAIDEQCGALRIDPLLIPDLYEKALAWSKESLRGE